MSVKIRPYRGGGWEVDIRVVSPDGTRHKRERKHVPISSRTGSHHGVYRGFHLFRTGWYGLGRCGPVSLGILRPSSPFALSRTVSFRVVR